VEASGGKHALAQYMLGLLAMNEGDDRAAAALFSAAVASADGHFPASHNNLGVMLARGGRLAEAEREFEVALRQAGGEFQEATHNLELCRSLRLTASLKARLSSLKTVETSFRPGE